MKIKLAKARRKKGWTQHKLAKRAKLSRSCISNIESGHRRLTAYCWHKIGRALAS